MSIRVLLSVVLAAALVAAAAPAVDSVRTARADHMTTVALDDLDDAIAALQRSDPAPALDVAARRVIRVRLPDRSRTGATTTLAIGTADIDYAGVDGPRSDVLVAQVGEGETRRVHVHRTHVDVRVLDSDGVAADHAGLRLRGDATLILAYIERNGRPTILVREFIPENGANASYDS